MVLEENGKINWSEKATNVDIIERICEKRTLLNNILRRNVMGPDIF